MGHDTLESDLDCDVLVCRSRLDPDVGVCGSMNCSGAQYSKAAIKRDRPARCHG